MGERKKSARLPFLDWMRGVAAAIMLQGHVFHAFASPGEREGAPYMFSQFFGGITPALFLFLTGITFSMGMDRPERLRLSNWGRVRSALFRARYLFLLAFLFRFQLWAFGLPNADWRDLLKVDILNCMGFSMAVFAPLAQRSARDRARLGLIAGMLIAAFSPLVSAVDWSFLPWYAADYFVPSYVSFSLFPWGAFLAFGIAAGAILSLVTQEQMHRVMQWATLGGLGLILGGQYFSNLPLSIYSRSEYWLNSPALVASKLGCVLLVAAVAFLWTEHFYEHWSWLRQIGSTSLVVYWVHIEVVYGRWFGPWKERLTAIECGVWSVALILAMIGLSMAWTRVLRVRARLAPAPA